LAENVVYGFAQGWKHSDGGQRKEYKQKRVLNQILAFLITQEFLYINHCGSPFCVDVPLIANIGAIR
jgi:hypothetical protein